MQFEKQEIDVLVGTQMVVKGLDFDHVNLVGILDADGLLSFADFRVFERAFQLMEQVSGRAGRKGSQGRVILQTTNPAHPVLPFVVSHNYAGFFDFEMQSRKQFHYPPFTRLIQLTFKHKFKDRADAAASLVARNLSTTFGNYIIGPAEPVVSRVKQLYLVEVLLKLPKDAKLNNMARAMLHQQQAILQNDRVLKSVQIEFDVDVM
jgi:primosomal protein N' (replication factor Y)